MTQSIDYLTKATGKRPVGIRAPSWALSRYSLGQFCEGGLLYDSSLMGADDPYEVMINGQALRPHRAADRVDLDDAPDFGQAGALPPRDDFKVYRDEFDVAYNENAVCSC